jgi:hypothetical protein
MKTLFVKWLRRQLEDRADILAANLAIAEGGEPISWEEVKKQLGLS